MKKVYRLSKQREVEAHEHSESLKNAIKGSPELMEVIHDLIQNRLDNVDSQLDNAGTADNKDAAFNICSLAASRKELKALLKLFKLTEE